MSRLVFSGKSTSLQVDENGVWTSPDLFVPWGTVKVFKLISSPNKTDWLIYSPSLQWGYVTTEADQFTVYAEEFAGASETAEVTREHFGRVTAWEFSDGRRLEYSTRQSMLIRQQGPTHQQPRVKNERWIEYWSTDQGYQLTDDLEIEPTEEERALVASDENKFTWGEFTKQEPKPPVSFVRIVLTVIAIILGFLFGIWVES